MLIDNTTIEIISHFGNILQKMTEDKILRTNINVHKNYFAMILPQMIFFYDNPDKRDDFEFTVKDTKLIGTVNKSMLKNENFVLEFNEALGKRKIATKSGSISLDTFSLESDLLGEKELYDLINAEEIGSFRLNLKDDLNRSFSGVISSMKSSKLTPYIRFASAPNEAKTPVQTLTLLDEPVIESYDYDETQKLEISCKYEEAFIKNDVIGCNGSFDFYLNQSHLSKIAFTDTYNVSVKKNGFCVFTYAGGSTELKGLRYIFATWQPK